MVEGCGVCGFGCRVHLHIADPMLVGQSGRANGDHQLAPASPRRLDIDTEDARARRRLDPEHLRRARPAAQVNLDLAIRQCLEGVETRQVNGKS